MIASGFPRCEPTFEPADEVCSWSPPELDPPPAMCAGTFYEGEDCPDLGYTVPCRGGSYVRPGTPCG